MRNTKLMIERKLPKIPKERLSIKIKELAPDIEHINNGLTSSVLFKDIKTNLEIRTKLTNNLQQDRFPDLTKLPFNDICILTDFEYTNTEGKRVVIDNALLSRFTKSQVDDSIVIITTYMFFDKYTQWRCVNFKAVHVLENRFDLVAFDTKFKGSITDMLVDGVNGLELELLNSYIAFSSLMSYEFVKIEKPLSFSERKHVAKNLEPKYVEYTLDLSKPSKRHIYKSTKSKGGTHASPCEHLRRGHLRTYKSGKQVWVNGITVNKGSNSGIVEKDYSLGQ